MVKDRGAALWIKAGDARRDCGVFPHDERGADK
jgi:hypothetical protein